MRNKPKQWIIRTFLALILVTTNFHEVASQVQTVEAAQRIQTDSTLKSISFSEIFIAAGESRVEAMRITSNLLSEKEIIERIDAVDSSLILIDKSLREFEQNYFPEKNQRFLTNQRVYWQRADDYLKEQKLIFSNQVRQLQSHKQKLERELKIWRITEKTLDSPASTVSVYEAIEEVTTIQETVINDIQRRTQLLISPLNRLISISAEVELLLEQIETALSMETSVIYSRSAPAIYEVVDDTDSGQGFIGQTLESLRFEWNTVRFYYQGNKMRFSVYLIFVIGVFILFLWIRNRLNLIRSESPTYYQRMFFLILDRPLSTAAVFSLFFTRVIFPERPPLLIDLTILFLLLPILNLTLRLASGRNHKIIYAFASLMILFLITHVLQANTSVYPFILLSLGIIELVLLVKLQIQKHYKRFARPFFIRFAKFFIAFHLVIVALGVAATLMGFTKFSQAALESPLNNTLLALLLFILLVTIIGALQSFIDSDYGKRFRVIEEYNDFLKSWVSRLVLFFVLFIWIDSVLRIFYLRNPVYNAIKSVMTREIGVGSMTLRLLDVLMFIVIIWLSVLISRVIKIVLREDVLTKFPLEKGVPRMIMAIAQFMAITFGVILAVRAIGMPVDQLTIIFSAFSVGIGFGLQNIFNNLVSGIILLFERPVQIDDTIEVGNLIGKVHSMGIRSSHIHTFDGAEVIIPNGQLISQEVVNWTLSDKTRRIEILSGVAYGSDVYKVQQLLLEAVSKHPDVIKVPTPLVLFNNLGESSLDFRILFWTDRFDEWIRIRSEVMFAVYDTLTSNGISIPFPQRDLHLKNFNLNDFKENNNESD
ncbi:mechanosensitive ion channel family protein [Robertkochia aurantiaca]|uniref:mechanosensitive ion channel family protein n=1 Tax=Robertkochia aurantiaca TaxID=2873700 RepID=UPI001CCC9966|nr:mechanosensitive ion channel domain-containing protein [Robertkochia sp. 3YJGBD-33]